MSITRMMAAALAAALVTPAAAQTSRAAEERYRRATGRTPPAQARPAPAPAPGAQGQAQATGQQAQEGQATPLSEEQRQAFGAVHAQSKLAAEVGDMAATRGASQEIQNLGRWLAEDHRRLDGELATLVKERGVDLTALAAGPERQRVEGERAQLNTRSGEEFDREFVSFLTRNGVAFVDALKRARDVTPGKDARLKKFLDDAENTEEGHLAASRQLKSQRQARTPPAR